MLFLRYIFTFVLCGCVPGALSQLYRQMHLEQNFAQCVRKYYTKFNNIENTVGLSMKAHCQMQAEWKLMRKAKINKKLLDKHPRARTYLRNIKSSVSYKHDKHRVKRQAPEQMRVREEYRMMSDERRETFHRAVRKMKTTDVRASLYKLT